MRARRSLFEPAEGSLGRAVGWGAVTTGGAQAVRLGCQIASVIVLSRLLPPEQFGIVAMAAPVLAFVGLFQDLGLVEATIQRKTITHAEVNLLFWINMFISVVLSGLMIAVAPLIAGFYGQPAAGVLLAATSVNMVVGSATSQHYAILARRMEFGWTAVIDSVAAVAGLGTAIVWALFDPTFWALYAGALATAVCGCSGIGQGISEVLTQEGARVAVIARRAPDPDWLARTGAQFHQAELSDDAACAAAVAAVRAAMGPVYGLVNNAGANDGVGLGRGPDAFRESLDQNLVHYYLMVDLLADGEEPVDDDGAVELALDGYGYRWLRVVGPDSRRLV